MSSQLLSQQQAAGGDENIANPSGPVGSLGDYTMQQPRSKLEAQGAPFPATVNGRFVDPANPRPWQADKGAYNPWTGYFWTGLLLCVCALCVSCVYLAGVFFELYVVCVSVGKYRNMTGRDRHVCVSVVCLTLCV